MTRVHSYLVHGLRVRSPYRLEAEPCDVMAPDAVVSVVPGSVGSCGRGDVVADYRGQDSTSGYVLTRQGACWSMVFPGVAAATFDHGASDVHVTVAESVPQALLAVLIGGPIVAALALARGHHLLHSSGVSWGPVGGVALVGPSGAGKSSIARLLVRPGRPLLSDDAVRIDPAQEVWAHRGTTSSRLRTDVVICAGDRWDTTVDGRILLRDFGAAPARVPLRLLLRPLLSPEFKRPRLRPMSRASAVLEIAGNSPLAGLRAADVLDDRLRWAVAVSLRLPMMLLEVPWSASRGSPDREALAQVVSSQLAACDFEDSSP